MPKNERVAFPVALVTGGSRGIGEAVVRTLAEAGYAVAINCSSEKSLEAAESLAVEVAQEHGVQTKAVCADVSSFQEVAAMVAEVQAMWGRIDVLVNNAGITRDGLLARMSEDRRQSEGCFQLRSPCGSYHDETAIRENRKRFQCRRPIRQCWTG